MGCFGNCCRNCLASCCMLLMAGVSFTFFDLGNAISGSLFVNLGDALRGLLTTSAGGGTGTLLSIVVGGLLGLGSVLMFPIHWMLYYRPDEPAMAIALLLPWILCIGITSLIFAKRAKDGFIIAAWLAGGYILLGALIFIGLSLILGAAGAGTIGSGVINGIFVGLTGLPPVLSIFLACLEGGLIGGTFGALIGAMKYNPAKQTYDFGEGKSSKKDKKQKKEKISFDEPTSTGESAFSYGTTTSDGKKTTQCPYCGANIKEGIKYCLNCKNYL